MVTKDERPPGGGLDPNDDPPIDSIEYPGLIDDIKDAFDCDEKTAKDLKSRLLETIRKMRKTLER